MIGDKYLTVSEALGVSLTGIVVVFLALIALLIAIKIISAVVGSIEGSVSHGEENAVAKPASQSSSPAPRAQAKVNNEVDPQTLAAIIGAISMERRSKIDGFKIVSITEVK